MLRHLLPPRLLRALPRVVKRKMSNFARKRDRHRYWPQPTKPPDEAVVIQGQRLAEFCRRLGIGQGDPARVVIDWGGKAL